MRFLKLLLPLMLAGHPLAAHAETLRFKSETNLKQWTATIGGELSFPRGPGPFPGVIFMHGCGGLNPVSLSSLQAHARYLVGAGFATLILDSFSARNLSDGRVCDPGPLSGHAIDFGRDDAYNAMDALQKHAKISKDNVFLVGQSHGAMVGLHTALNLTHHPPFRAVAAFYPGCSILGTGGPLRSPLLILAAGKDDWTPAQTCTYAKQIDRFPGAEFELVLYPGALHCFDMPGATRRYKGHLLGYNQEATADSRKRMKQFFIRHLTDDLKATAPFAGRASR